MGFKKGLLVLLVLGVSYAAQETEVEMPEEVGTQEPEEVEEVQKQQEITMIEGCLVPFGPKKGYRRHPSDCRKFIQNAPYGGQEMLCGPGTVWDQDQLRCEHASAIRCRVGIYRYPSGLRCPGLCQFECPRAFGFFPHPRDCQRYFSCRNGVVKYRTCGVGKLFDARTSSCVQEAYTTCNASYDADC